MRNELVYMINFPICDFPGQIDFFDPDIDVESIFSDWGALVYIFASLGQIYSTNLILLKVQRTK